MANQSQFAAPRVILVPLANPANAERMLRLALALVHPDEGRVIGLIVTTGETEKQIPDLDALEAAVAAINQNGKVVKLNRYVAASVTRGVLDAVREEHADMLLLGMQRRASRSHISAINASIAETAPCSVLFYHAGRENKPIERITIPVDGTEASRAAAKVGIVLSQRLSVPVEAVRVDTNSDRFDDAEARLGLSLRGLEGEEIVKRRIIQAENAAEGMISRLSNTELTILGLSERRELDEAFDTPFVDRLLDHAPGAVLIIARMREQGGARGFFSDIWHRIDFNLTDIEQDELEWRAERLAAPNLDYFVLASVATTLASVGLILNNATVLLGAMLVAPLMQPLIAIAVGIGAGRLALIRRGLVTLTLGILTVLFVSIIVGEIVGTVVLTREILGRTNPSIADLVVALASGVIGAYATVRRDIPSALIGVAIAVALVPPICVIGLNIVLGNALMAERAFVLLLTNLVAMTLAALLTFLWVGVRVRREWVTVRLRRGIVLGLAALVVIGSAALGGLITRANNRPAIEAILKDSFAQAEVVEVEIIPANPTRVVFTLRTTGEVGVADVRAAQDRINSELLETVELEAVVQQVIDPGG